MKKKHGLHLTKKEFMDKYENFKMNYDIISEWTNDQEIHTVLCKKCNHKWNTRPYNVAKGKSKCPFCEGAKTNYDKLFVSQVLEDNGFLLLDDFKTKDDVVRVKHKECGHIFERTVQVLMAKRDGKRYIACPKCKENSMGEKIIAEVLSSYGINFKREIAFKDLRGTGNGYLRYDFGIYEKDNLKYLIEFDGKQHFQATKWKMYGEEYHEELKIHDKIKNEYAEKNNLILLRIPYGKRRTVDKIIINFLNEHKLIPSQASQETARRCND